jgi:hypothetical protein
MMLIPDIARLGTAKPVPIFQQAPRCVSFIALRESFMRHEQDVNPGEIHRGLALVQLLPDITQSVGPSGSTFGFDR